MKSAKIAAEEDRKTPSLSVVNSMEQTIQTNPLDEEFDKKPVRWHIAQFGMMWAAILLFWGAYRAIKYGSLTDIFAAASVAALCVWIGYRVPALFFRAWRSWMKLAEILAVIVTPVVMTALWIVTFVPFSIGLKLLRIKVINTDFRTDTVSYWLERDQKKDQIELYKNQF
jgi:hypothetical protein